MIELLLLPIMLPIYLMMFILQIMIEVYGMIFKIMISLVLAMLPIGCMVIMSAIGIFWELFGDAIWLIKKIIKSVDKSVH